VRDETQTAAPCCLRRGEIGTAVKQPFVSV
jgi:hypothetical protein